MTRLGGAFSFGSDRSYPRELSVPPRCAIGELASALSVYCPAIADFSHYLAALLIDAAGEVPIIAGQVIAFGAAPLLREQTNSDLKTATLDFLAIGNAVKLLCGSRPLEEILSANGQPVERYGNALMELAQGAPDLHTQLVQRNHAARMFARAAQMAPFNHTKALLEELRDAGDWDALRQQAERHIGVDDPVANAHVKRMLALVPRPLE